MTRVPFPLAGGLGDSVGDSTCSPGQGGHGRPSCAVFPGEQGEGLSLGVPASDAGTPMAAEGIFFVGLTCKPFPFPYIKPAFAESAHSSVG